MPKRAGVATLEAMKTALIALLDTNLKLMRRRRDSRALAAAMTRARDTVLAHQGPPNLLLQNTCDRIVRLVAVNGVERESPAAKYKKLENQYTALLQLFGEQHPDAPPAAWRGRLATIVRDEGHEPLAPKDVDEVLAARTIQTKARRLVFHLHGVDDGFNSFEDFSRSVRRAKLPL